MRENKTVQVPGTDVVISITYVGRNVIVKRTAAPELGFTLERDVRFYISEEERAREFANELWQATVDARNLTLDRKDKIAYAKLEQAQEDAAYASERD